MKLTLPLVLFLFFACPGTVHAASRKFNVCIDKNGALTARKHCPKGMQALTTAAIAALQPTLKGPAGPAGPAGVSDLATVDGEAATSIPACAIFIGTSCNVPGSVQRTASCPAGQEVVGAYCISKQDGFTPTTTQPLTVDYSTATCVISNINALAIVGKFYARVVCLPAPPI